MKVSRMAIWKLEKRYNKLGEIAIEGQKKGRPREPLNPKFRKRIIAHWHENKCGARKLHTILKKKGYGVSKRKIEQVLIKEGFQKPFPKRRKPRKYKRFEWPIPNYMWHCDWHIIKHPLYKGQKLLVFLDDCSRKIMSHILGDMTTQNSIFALYDAINKHNVTPYCLNSDRGTQFYPNKKNKNRNASHAFQQELKDLGIIFIPSKPRHPQTNGKNEKWFDIFEKEFDERFKTIDDFINWYNKKRISEALDYLTPNEAYKKRL